MVNGKAKHGSTKLRLLCLFAFFWVVPGFTHSVNVNLLSRMIIFVGLFRLILALDLVVLIGCMIGFF